MVHLHKIFSKNLFEILINLNYKSRVPRGMCGKQPLFLLHRHVQFGNPIRNYYSNQNVAPRHIQNLIASRKLTKVVHERETRRLHINWQWVLLSSLQESWLWKNSEMFKPAPEVNYLLKLSSIRFTFVFHQVQLQIKLCRCRIFLFWSWFICSQRRNSEYKCKQNAQANLVHDFESLS